jgi:catechol 2,3-dioxygenase-like lactoylglutathione lyase family enzyme
MGIQALNHYNLRVPRGSFEQFERFYVDILGFRAQRLEPQGLWLYAAGQPLVHVTPTEDATAVVTADRHTTGVVDHVAFTCDGLDALLEHFTQRNVRHSRRDFPEHGFVQIVVHDPLGLKIELNFVHGVPARKA